MDSLGIAIASSRGKHVSELVVEDQLLEAIEGNQDQQGC
jgi:hypothetical protein